jgi:anion-transporting  ArsA/GET3 family ATPase
LIFVTGKGGVGKSTVAAALGALAAARGKRVVVAEVQQRADVEHAVLAAGADHLSIDPQAAMEEYLVDQLPRPLAELLKSSRSFGYLAAATPGMTELLTAGKLWELAQDERRTPGAQPYDLVIADAPATGHGLALLRAPRTFAGAAKVGPIARQGATIDALLSDPAQTAVVAVTIAEEMPVNETLGLCDGLRESMGYDPALVVVNGLRPDRFTNAEAAALTAAQAQHPALAAALSLHATAREQRHQSARLRRHLAEGVASLSLPYQPDGPDVAALARKLERAA